MGYLLITESPAKAKKIKSFLSNEYQTKSSCGHIVDLEKKKLSIDVTNDFKPTYKVLSDKKDIVKELKLHSQGKQVILAADDDREGEAIAWHCANILNVDVSQKNRIVFREISKQAILKSLKSPQTININEVNSQQTRRIIDRLIGFKLSPCLWKHIKTKESGLSAGRVQSALLNLLHLRETYIDNYDPDISLDIKGQFTDLKESEFIFSTIDESIDIDSDFIKRLFHLFSTERTFKVIQSKESKDKSYPPKPFITSTLQQSAQNELGLNVKTTMDIAQKLYEAGHITYMRTDSTFISKEFQNILQNHITETFDESYYKIPNEKKVKGAQEAHEAIRPTSFEDPSLDGLQLKVYNFIKKRTIISHMKPAEYKVFTIKLQNDTTKQFGYFLSKYKLLSYPGYLIYTKQSNDVNKNENMSFQEEYILESCFSSEKEETKPQLYNESSIVKLLEDTGIGRPSTYANIISTLSNRKYTVQDSIKMDDRSEEIITLFKDNTINESTKLIQGNTSKSRIILTPLGKNVLSYLQTHFMNILDPKFTSAVENDLDLIATGKVNHIEIIRKVYNSFIDIVDTQMGMKSIKQSLKVLGEKSGKIISIGKGKYGVYLQVETKKGEKKNSSIEKYLEMIRKDETNVSFQECVNFLKYPRSITDDINIHIGPYGYYMRHSGRNYKLPNDTQKHTKEYCNTLLTKSPT